MNWRRTFLGNWFKIPVYIHFTWYLLLLFIFLVIGMKAALLTLCIYVIVLLHEFGHCFASRYFGNQIEEICLYPFGGVASMGIANNPWQEFIITLAGPAVNLLFVGPLWLLSSNDFLFSLFLCNLANLVFNLLPAFPMDGGRLLRAALVHFWTDHVTATRLVIRISQGFCILFVICGLWQNMFMLLIVAGFVWFAGRRELETTQAVSAQEQSQQILLAMRRQVSRFEQENDRLL